MYINFQWLRWSLKKIEKWLYVASVIAKDQESISLSQVTIIVKKYLSHFFAVSFLPNSLILTYYLYFIASEFFVTFFFYIF